ncbi:MAG: Uma2 family endonuclease [Armatimonadetes bacterium]|nr:Uma2 family endonuclease [Anaerolineae bacterium]
MTLQSPETVNTTPIPNQPMTVEEFWEWCELPTQRGNLYELIDGYVVIKATQSPVDASGLTMMSEVNPVGSFTPSRIAEEIVFALMLYLRQNPIGYVTVADGSYRLPSGIMFMPDVGYITKARLPQVPVREVPVPPDFAVEVMSPHDSKRALRRKAEACLAAGSLWCGWFSPIPSRWKCIIARMMW